MKSLYIFCEGPTERGFCNQVLSPHLSGLGIFVHTILIAHNRHHRRVHRGGMPDHFRTLHDDIRNHLKLHQRRVDAFFTTMIDLYRSPGDFPGKAANTRIPENPTPYIMALEQEFAKAIDDPRFIPYVQLHEYETLLFANPDAFAGSFDECDRAIQSLKAIAVSFPTIEHINDGSSTTPSKRIIALIPEYKAAKTTAGPDIAARIGLPRLREACPHFDGWVTRLEGL